MSEQKPVELCEDCPLRALLPDGAEDPGKERFISVVGKRTVAQTWIGGDGSGHLEIDRVSGPKEVEIAILSEGVTTGPAFWLSGGEWRLASVETAINNCDGPDIVKTGFLKLRKRPVCRASKSF